MTETSNAQTRGDRKIVESLDREFARLHANSCALVDLTTPDILYATDQASSSFLHPSIGESILRSAAVVEQTFGGITANLWDDPFEWTLPEYLSTPDKVREHLLEVEMTRKRAFDSFVDDACLVKEIATPANETRGLLGLLLEALLRATRYQAQAQLVLQTLSGNSPAGFII